MFLILKNHIRKYHYPNFAKVFENMFYLYKSSANKSGIFITPPFQKKDDCDSYRRRRVIRMHAISSDHERLVCDGIVRITIASKRCQYAVMQFLTAKTVSDSENYF